MPDSRFLQVHAPSPRKPLTCEGCGKTDAFTILVETHSEEDDTIYGFYTRCACGKRGALHTEVVTKVVRQVLQFADYNSPHTEDAK
jgi:hypothetical protein